MQVFAVLGTLAFVVVGAVVGTRLLLLARRTRQLPELAIGAGLFVYAVITQPMLAASQPLGEAFGTNATLAALGVGLFANIISMGGIYVFTWCVFRRDSSVAKAAVGVAVAWATINAAALWASVAYHGVGDSVAFTTRLGLIGMSLNFGVGMAWTGAESLRYHRLMRRRLALGLAEPAVVNRFLLWGIGSAACALLVAALVFCAAVGMHFLTDPAPILLMAANGATCAICWYLAFIPPTGYVRWIERRAVARGVSS